MGGFGAVRAEKPASKVVRPEVKKPMDRRDVRILSKPKPEYTARALERKIEGSVVLEVVFQGDGRVRVVRLLRGLGHGLDEKASAAARAIRFEAARENGLLVDTVARLEISFRMAY